MTDEVADLFSDSPYTMLLVHAGEFRGKEGVRRFFRSRGADRGRHPREFFHQVMQLNPDGPSPDTFYPAAFICPFHFKHPVTGEATPVIND